jgi:outer membrane protein TolC
MLSAACLAVAVLLCMGAPACAGQPASFDLSLNDAILLMLENNPALEIQRLNPESTKLNETRQDAAFDTDLSASVSGSNREADSGAKSRSNKASVDLSQRLTSGESVSLGLTATNADATTADGRYTTGLGLTVTKPLLQGAGSAVNLVSLRQAQLDSESSRFELQAYAETLVKNVIDTYWNYALALRKIQIYESSLQLAKDQYEETDTRVEIGSLAEIDLVAARAEVALREQSLINAHSSADALRLTLLRLMHPGSNADFWDAPVSVSDALAAPAADPGPRDAQIAAALQHRPDLNQARLNIQRGELDVVKTKNGLLPYLDAFVTLGRTGYASTFGSSAGDIFSDASDISAGLSMSYTLGNRSDKVAHKQTQIKQEQLDLAMANLKALAQEDVRGAWIELERARSQVTATTASLQLQQEKLRAESEKYRVGRSTILQVNQAQRDALQAEVDQAQALADTIKALSSLYAQQGLLLDNMGITL